jgi:DnaK suppressor protein
MATSKITLPKTKAKHGSKKLVKSVQKLTAKLKTKSAGKVVVKSAVSNKAKPAPKKVVVKSVASNKTKSAPKKVVVKSAASNKAKLAPKKVVVKSSPSKGTKVVATAGKKTKAAAKKSSVKIPAKNILKKPQKALTKKNVGHNKTNAPGKITLYKKATKNKTSPPQGAGKKTAPIIKKPLIKPKSQATKISNNMSSMSSMSSTKSTAAPKSEKLATAKVSNIKNANTDKTAGHSHTTKKPQIRKPSANYDATIKGFTPYEIKKGENYMNELQRKHFRHILLNWRNELMEEVDRTMHHMQDEASNPPDPADRATLEEEFSIELRTRDRERRLIKKIDSTIELIANDNYGYCETCGVEIGIRRLEARPTANKCIDCKTLDEIKEKQLGAP